MNTAMIAGILRAILAAIGGGTLAVSDSEISAIVGALVTLATIGWSIYEKRNNKNNETK